MTGESEIFWETTNAERDHRFARSVPLGETFAKITPRLQETAPPVPHFCMPMNVNHVFDISLGLSFVYSKDKNVNKIFFQRAGLTDRSHEDSNTT